MKFTKKMIMIELLALFTMLGMSNTAEFYMTKKLLNQGYKKQAIEEHYNNTRYNKPIVGKTVYELNKPGRELAYYIHSKF